MIPSRKAILGFAAVLLLGGGAAAYVLTRAPDGPALKAGELPVGAVPYDGPEPAIVLHRGLEQLAPEDTLAAFEACLVLGWGFEFDVQRTKDGVYVCLHDETLDRTTDGSGPVAAKTFAEVKELDAGAWYASEFRGARVPSIEEVLDLLRRRRRPGICCFVDFKIADAAVVEDVLDLAASRGLLDCVVVVGEPFLSPNKALRARVRAKHPGAQIALLANTEADLDAMLADPTANWIYVPFPPSAEGAAKIRRAGRKWAAQTHSVRPEQWLTARARGPDVLFLKRPFGYRDALRTLASREAEARAAAGR